MDAIMNRMRLEAQWVLGNEGKTELGLIDSYDPSSYSVKVKLPAKNGKITGWMPLGTLAVGPGYGIMFGPEIGAQIKISYQEGDPNAPVADLQVFDNVNHPSANSQPGPPSGEWWLIHKSGSTFKFTNDGKLTLNSGEEIDIGNAASAYQSLATIAIMGIFNNHVHTNGNDGSDTGMPTTQMTMADFTTVLKAN
jgi:uncharacterized protein involved in type VI secretion and phage assembly